MTHSPAIGVDPRGEASILADVGRVGYTFECNKQSWYAHIVSLKLPVVNILQVT